METVFYNARVVMPEVAFSGAVKVEDGVITDVSEGDATVPGGVDCNGDILMPGIVDLHTDNLEKHFEPRPGVTWDSMGAVIAHDGQMAAAGITTVFDSLGVYGTRKGFDRAENLAPMLNGLQTSLEKDLLRVDHKVHLRCEVSIPGLSVNLSPHAENPLLGLLSIMDHTPGQRQYRHMTEEQFVEMLKTYERTSDQILEALKRFRKRDGGDHIDDNRALIAEVGRSRDVPLASHDDETEGHIDDAIEQGATIAEFPVTLEAAKLSNQKGLDVVMGAPNLLRGGSHSGNISAAETVHADVMNILASDYLPVSLLRAALMLTGEPFNWSLPRAIRTVTEAPANAVGLRDRGAIVVGRRADLLRVKPGADACWPKVQETWVKGQRVA